MEKLRFSENHRYFIREDGTPFPFLADTVWTMPQRMKWDDADYLMKRRKEQGFTVLQIVALDPEQDVEMRNPVGEKALVEDDLSRPNEKYFQYLDWILDRAEFYGFYVLLLPVWGQLVVGDNWLGGTFRKTVTEENAYAYGEWIGNRYRNRKNILWCLGGDRQPIHKGVDYKAVWRKLAEGLGKGLSGKELPYNGKPEEWEKLMITYHSCYEMETGKCSSMSYWTDEEKWISFIMLQSGHGGDTKNYELVRKEYDREKVMPVWDGEPAYEMMPTSFPDFKSFHGSFAVRKRAYWSLLSGAFGYTYGHCSVWPSISEKEKNTMFRMSWCEALSCEGAEQIRHIRAFLDSIRPMELIPDNEIMVESARKSAEKAGAGIMENETVQMHRQAAVSPSGDRVCIYLPSGGEVELNLQRIMSRNSQIAGTGADDTNKNSRTAGQYFAWWYNPRDGRFYDKDNRVTECGTACGITNHAETEAENMDESRLLFVAPESGEEKDWILILTKSEKELPVTSGIYGEKTGEEAIKKVFEWGE